MFYFELKRQQPGIRKPLKRTLIPLTLERMFPFIIAFSYVVLVNFEKYIQRPIKVSCLSNDRISFLIALTTADPRAEISGT